MRRTSDLVLGLRKYNGGVTPSQLPPHAEILHRRIFFAQFHLDTLQSWLATAESVIGTVIEGVFVAMLIQRLFR
jgi:hypothetical protein